MAGPIAFRESLPADGAALERLYAAAFPAEDLLPLLRALLSEGPSVLSLVAMDGATLVGHVALTLCGIAGTSGEVALLGPLAVTPERQRQGLGSALVHEGLRRLRSRGVVQVHVLGDPAYYRRFGFRTDAGVAPPYPLPQAWREAWQTLSLRSDAPPLRGRLRVPQPWRRRALWAP